MEKTESAKQFNTAEYRDQLDVAAKFVRSKLGEAQIAVVLGSGLKNFTDVLTHKKEIPYADIPHMPTPTVAGHSGTLILGQVGETSIFCLAGRSHAYEGLHMYELTFTARLLRQIGVRLFIATNAAGGCGVHMEPGCIMFIEDHINLQHRNPLADTFEVTSLGDRNSHFDNIYSKKMRDYAQKLADKMGDIKNYTGVYGCMCGPTYETPSEVRAGRILGVSAFGMSTVPEVLAAKSAGMEVFAISLITNMAAGIVEETLTHEDVQAVANKAGPMFVRYMEALIKGLDVEAIASTPVPVRSEHAPFTPTILPQPGALPATKEAIAEALDYIKKFVLAHSLDSQDAEKKSDESLFGTAYFIAHGHDAQFLKNLHDVAKLSYTKIPHFPVISASARNGSIAVGTTAHGVRVCALVHNEIEGLTCEEAVFVSQLFTRLGVKLLVHTFQAEETGKKHDAKNERIIVLEDCAEITTIHPTPQDLPLLQYLPGVSPLAFQKYGDKVFELAKKNAGAEFSAGSYLAYTAPCFPTPSEIKLAHAAQATHYGISCLALVYTCAASDIDVVGLATSGPLQEATEKNLASVLIDIADAARNHVHAKPRVEAAAMQQGSRYNKRQINYHLTDQVRGGVSQGDYEKVDAAARHVKEQLEGIEVTKAVVLDGALVEAVEGVKQGKIISKIPNMPEDLRLIQVLLPKKEGEEAKKSILVVDNLYYVNEGRTLEEIVAPIRLLGMIGIKTIYFGTRICSISPFINLNELVLLTDHINFSGRNPLFGPNVDKWGTRFPDMGDAYSAQLCAAAKEAAKKKGILLKEAMYAMVVGPVFASRMAASITHAVGAQALCTGLAQEVIVCKHMGLKVCAFGITSGNLAHCADAKNTNPVGDGTVSHEAISHLRSLLAELIN